MLVEVVHSIEEFIGKVDPHQDVHYEIESNIIGPIGYIAYVVAEFSAAVIAYLMGYKIL